MVRRGGGQELTVGVLVRILSCLCEWLYRVTGQRLCNKTLVSRERNDVVLVAINVLALMISQLVCVVHEITRVAEGTLRHVLLLVRGFAADVVGLSAPFTIHLRTRRPLLILLVVALPTHLLKFQVLNVSLEIGSTAPAAHE